MTEKLTTPVAYTSSGVCAIFGSITTNEIAAYGGLCVAFLTFLVNAWFQWDKRNREIKLLQEK